MAPAVLGGGHRLMTADRRILDWPGPLSCLRPHAVL